jgi:hypothetical protein
MRPDLVAELDAYTADNKDPVWWEYGGPTRDRSEQFYCTQADDRGDGGTRGDGTRGDGTRGDGTRGDGTRGGVGSKISVYAHAWLEDADGRVYDTLGDRPTIARIHQRRVAGSCDAILHGVSKARIVACGYHYVAAPTDVQTQVHARWVKSIRIRGIE